MLSFVRISYNHSASRFMTFLQFSAEKDCLEVPEHDLSLPLEVDGTVSYLETRLLTQEEIESLDRIELSSDIP